MPAAETHPHANDDRTSPIASCLLDRMARKQQEDRYRSLAGTVNAIDRGAGLLTVRFEERLDSALLKQTLAVERDCCPFFELEFDSLQRRPTIGVREADQAPALEVLATAFTNAHRAPANMQPSDTGAG